MISEIRYLWPPRRRTADSAGPHALKPALAAIALLFAATSGTFSACDPVPPVNDVLIYATQATAEEGEDASPPEELLKNANEVAGKCGGTLKIIRGAGQGGLQVGEVSLKIPHDGPDSCENNAPARHKKLAARLDAAFQRAWAEPVPGEGRDVIGLIATVSSQLGPGPNEVWLRTFGLGTVAPADARSLMAADPTQAVASIAQFVPPLKGVRIHLVLAPAAGRQQPLNPLTDAWRKAFMQALITQAGATVVDTKIISTHGTSSPDAPHAPVIPDLAYPPPPPPPHRDEVKLDSSATFKPDSAEFEQESAVVAQLTTIVSGWQAGGYSDVEVVGHTARFGPADTARQLSRQRAERVAELLRRQGVTTVVARGVGYDEPVGPDPQDAANRVVIITAHPKK